MKVLPRNHLAIMARQMRAGKMRDRRATRGGNRNEQADFIAEYEEEILEDIQQSYESGF